jgi:hypothetical protein
MRGILFTLMSVACTVAVSASVYKWVDENGVTHYSDQPHENAQKVELRAPQTYSAPPPSTRTTPPPPHSAATQRPAAPPYRSCTLSEPTNDQVYMNASSITASLRLEPVPRPGDRVVVTLDGQKVSGPSVSGGPFTIPVDRGSHALQVAVQDSGGQVVCQSSVTFHVHQPSLLAPNRPK